MTEERVLERIPTLVPGLVPRPRRPAEDELGAPRLRPRYRVLLWIADAVAAGLTVTLGAVVLRAIHPVGAVGLGVRELVAAMVALGAALHLHGLYRRPASRLRPSGWWRPAVVARCVPTATLLVLGACAVLPFLDRISLSAAVAVTVPAVLFVPLTRRALAAWPGPSAVTRIIIVGTGPLADRLTDRLGRCRDTVVIGHVDDHPEDGARVLGRLDDLADLCRRYEVDRVIVAFTSAPVHETLTVLRSLEGRVPLSVVPRLFELHSWRSEVEELQGLPLLHVAPAALSRGARVAKRSIDVVLATLALLAVTPIWLAAAVAIRVDSRGPVLFHQERIGRGGRPFRMRKFRTMSVDAWDRRDTLVHANEVDGPLFKMRDDPRVTTVGRILRRFSIDELPQLVNVLRGDMSLVGPRPLPTEQSDQLDGAALKRFDVRPGITGLWQVSGRSDLSYADLQHLDAVYVSSWSLTWDLRILAATPRSVVARRGAY